MDSWSSGVANQFQSWPQVSMEVRGTVEARGGGGEAPEGYCGGGGGGGGEGGSWLLSSCGMVLCGLCVVWVCGWRGGLRVGGHSEARTGTQKGRSKEAAKIQAKTHSALATRPCTACA